MVYTRYLVGDVAVHQRTKLPHWDAEHGLQFITLHLGRGRQFDHAGAAIVGDVIVGGESRRYVLLAWCVMPDHVHVVLRPFATLAAIVRAWKTISSRRLGGGAWWQSNYFDRLIRDRDELEKTIDYVMNNPETAGLLGWDFRQIYPDAIAEWM